MFFLLGIIYLCVFSTVAFAGGVTRSVYGTVKNSDTTTTPANGEIAFSAYIQARTNEVQTETSPGCGYNAGTLFLNVGNFPTPWTGTDTLIINVTNKINGEKKTVTQPLTGSGAINLGVLTLIPRQLTSIAITAPAATLAVGEGLQFTATGTYDDDSTGDITATAIWAVDSATPDGAGAFDSSVKGKLNALKAGSANVKATSGTVSSSTSAVTITAFGGTVMVAANPTSITADGVTTSTITATVKTSGGVANVVNGVPVTFAVTTGTGTVTASAVTAGGVTTATYTSSTKAGAEVVTATVGATSQTATVTLTAGAASKIGLTATPAIISSTIQYISELVATIYDAFDNIVTAFVNAVTFSVDSNTYGDIKTGDVYGTSSVNATGGVAPSQLESKVDATGGKIIVTAAATGLTSGTVEVTTRPFGISPASLPDDIRAGAETTFAATGGTGPFSWTFSGGSPGTYIGPTVVWTAPAEPGSVTVNLTDSSTPNAFTASETVTVYVLPDPVLNTVTTPTRNTKPVMSWGKVTNATAYYVQITLATDPNFSSLDVVAGTVDPSDTPSFTPVNALADGNYIWQVRAVDAKHTTQMVKGNTFTVDTTAPAAVTVFGITPQTSGNLKLDWTNPTDADFTGVIVVGATGAAPALAPVDGTTYTLGKSGQDDILYVGNLQTYTETLAHGINRYYKVFAYDAVKNYSLAAEANATSSDTTPTAAPTAPLPSAGNTEVTLSWTNPTDSDFAGIVILMKAGSAPTTGVPVSGDTYLKDATLGDATVAYAGYANKAATTTITGLINSTRYYFAIYAVDERPNYSATAASANAIPGPPVISAVPALPANVHVGGTVAFTATSGVGSYAWTATGGSLSAATGATTTWTAPATVTTVPTPFTVRVTNPTTGLYAEGVVNVYSSVAITDKPTTAPTVLSGMDSAAFTVAGGDESYTWTVTGPVAVAGGSGSSFTFKAPTTGAFAGEYTIKAADGKGGEDSFQVRVPFTLTPSSKAFRQDSPLTFTVGGVTGNVTWDMMSKSEKDGTFTKITATGDYGTWANANGLTNVFTPAASITTAKVFYLKILVDGYAYATAANGLNEQTFGPFQINPVALYTVNVLNGAVVAVRGQLDASGQPLKMTAAGGKATFTLPAGGKYMYDVSLANYVSQSVSSAEKTVNMTLAASTAAIAGTVTNSAGGAALVGAKVTAYLPATPAVQYSVMTDAAGAYAINLPTGAAATGWTVAAALNNFVADTKTGIPSPAAGENFVLTAMTPTSPDVNVGGGEETGGAAGQTVDVEVPAGGVTTNGYIIITPVPKDDTTANATSASLTIYDIKVTSDQAGTTPLVKEDIKRIVITLPIDLTVLKPGDLEKGVFAIYTATSRADLEAGKGAAVPVSQIIVSDYIGDGKLGSVTFWVSHLSFFGIGGGGGGETSTSGCFIATAAYGSYLEGHVMILRNFRDSYLLTNSLGQAFVAFYYRNSPPIADFIAKHDSLRAMVRLGLAPIVGAAYLTVNTTPVQKALILFVLIGLLFGGAAMIVRTRKFRPTIG
jgi:adhesin/invasin